MQKILKVAQREYVETVKTKTFLISLLFLPIIIGGVIVVSSWISRDEGGPRNPLDVGVTCPAPQLYEKVQAAFREHNEAHAASPLVLAEVKSADDPQAIEEQGKRRLREGTLDAYVVLDDDVLAGSGGVRIYTHKPKPAQMEAIWTIESLLRKAVVDTRCEARGLDRELLARIRNVSIQQVELGSEAGQEQVQGQGQRVARMMVPFAFMYLIFIGIAGTGQHLLSSIIEEKNSRIIEVLLSAISPIQLMAGKIVGLAGIGLTVTTLWGAGAYVAARSRGIDIAITPDLVVFFLVYYILGFTLFSAILAGVGSVCNTVKETQSLMMPVMLLFIIPLISWFKLAQDPNGTLAHALSFLPPATPMVMMLRLSTGAGIAMTETIGTIVLLAVSVLAAVWAAAKIFRTGVLMYGKRPGLREVMRCLKAR
ncbi:MAG: ABC transporter permease [Sedimentisphaerales bacterium]|nr:ABC transporter permease [Sedimentisphaerales bacterium]